MSLGGSEGLTKNQGFYIYRNKRLLIWGTYYVNAVADRLKKDFGDEIEEDQLDDNED